MEKPISASNQCLSDQVYIVDGGASKKMTFKAPLYIIGSKSLNHFSYVPKHRTEARSLFMTYVRTRMFYQMRMRNQDGQLSVHIPSTEINKRFFRKPRFNRKYEIQGLRDQGELELSTKTNSKGFTQFYYKSLKDGPIDFSLLKPHGADLNELTFQMRDFLLTTSLKANAPLTPYFKAFLDFKDQFPDLFFIVDRFSGRVHTPITNFHRTHRPNLLIQGEPTSSLDVTTMQPLLLGKILEKQIGQNEFSTWINSGEDIYTMLQFKAKLDSRDEGKKRFFEILFSKPNKSLELMFGASNWIQWINNYKSKPEKLNPHTMEKEHSNLAWLLQSTEVSLMSKVWRQYVDEGITFLSVHDEVIVKKVDIVKAENIFREILAKEFKYYKLNPK